MHRAPGTSRRRLVAVLVVTATVLVAELIGAFVTGWLALLADAGHLVTGVADIAQGRVTGAAPGDG